ncbi:MAG: TlpA disulfide reductase family protein [Opitutaceae bacterium]
MSAFEGTQPTLRQSPPSRCRSWCPPCRAEIPGFVDLYKRYADKGLVIVGVSLDQQGPAVVRPFVEKFGVNYPIVMGDAKIASAFGGIEALPTTFVIDRSGKIVRTHVGYTNAETFEKDIKPLL